MLGDPTATLAKDFDVYIDGAGIPERGTFILDPNGNIGSYEVAQGNVGRNAKELLRKVQAAQYLANNVAEAAPAGWEPGKNTLTPGIDLVGKL